MFQQRYTFKAKTLVATGLLTLLGLSSASASAADCDRACLGNMLTKYVDALIAHDASKLPLADNVKFTEDSKDAKLGEGIWKSVTAKTVFRQDYLDVKKQVAAAHMVLMEGDKNQAQLSVLLYIKDNKITGIETLVNRITPESRFQPKELGAPVRGFPDAVPAGKKMARDAMIKTALTYPEGLRIGSFIDGDTPFAKEAYRVENGVITAGQGCGRGDCNMYAQNLMVHPSIIANVAVVDEENGVVVLWMNFGHTGDSYGVGNSLITFEAFKVWGGEIHSVNAFFKGLPIGTSRYWPTSDRVAK